MTFKQNWSLTAILAILFLLCALPAAAAADVTVDSSAFPDDNFRA